MAKTENYGFELPNPSGIQLTEIDKIAQAIIAIDLAFKSASTALTQHTHTFESINDLPSTLAGYGIKDAMTADQVAEAIGMAVSGLLGSDAPETLDTLSKLAAAVGGNPKFSADVATALGLRVSVDAVQGFTQAQKTQGRSNLDALGAVDKGKANGVAPLDANKKVPEANLPALTTTATVGAATAAAASKQTPADSDFFSGVLAGGSTMFKTTWGNIKTAMLNYLQPLFDNRYLRLIGGTITGGVTFKGNIAVEGRTEGRFRHTSDYFEIHSFGSGYGVGYAQLWWNANASELTLAGRDKNGVSQEATLIVRKITGLIGPTINTDAATKGYVDTKVAGIPGGATTAYQAFTASGTWTKPAGLAANALVVVEVWGGGGGGGDRVRGGGGGGGGYAYRQFRASQLSATVAVTVGAGGAKNANGGTSRFGSYLTATGGMRGSSELQGLGGAGGTSVNPTFSGGKGGNGSSGSGKAGAGESVYYGGGGGGGGSDNLDNQGNGGTSVLGGTGGRPGNLGGSVPAGGGSSNNVGARGEVRIHVIG